MKITIKLKKAKLAISKSKAHINVDLKF